MQCTNCKRESPWMEIIGSDFICNKCVQKHEVMRLIYNRHIDTFRGVLKKLNIRNYAEYMGIKRQQLEKSVDFNKMGIKLKTTNVVELE